MVISREVRVFWGVVFCIVGLAVLSLGIIWKSEIVKPPMPIGRGLVSGQIGCSYFTISGIQRREHSYPAIAGHGEDACPWFIIRFIR
jgi:hypothetical protein